MLGSDVLEIAVGLVLIYLLMSLILTAVQESIENLLKTRAVNLERSIRELLQGDDALLARFYEHPLIYALYRGEYAYVERRKLGRKLPSYIPRETFATVLLDLARAEARGETNLNTLIAGFGAAAQQGGARLRREVEGWFDGAMDRASGWYKRRTQLRLFLIGLAVSVVLNVNSITIANYLAVSPQQRALVTALAEQAAASAQGVGSEAGRSLTAEEQAELRDELAKLGIPIGWRNNEWRKLWSGIPPFARTLADTDAGATLDGVVISVNLVLGYLITAFALMLGAPFWFDVLNRIMVIRATVKPKEKSPDEPSEDGGTDRLAPARPAPAGGQAVDPAKQ